MEKKGQNSCKKLDLMVQAANRSLYGQKWTDASVCDGKPIDNNENNVTQEHRM
jgi:hypothetical protein